jgi:hypothetical protein
MLNLDRITIVSINCRDPELSIKAIERSCKYINFKKCLLLSDVEIKHDYIETIIIPKIKSLEEYSYFCVKKLNDYIDTDFCLIVQPDGFVTNPFMWSDKFLNYDYIGAPWDKALSYRGLWMCGMLNDSINPNETPIITGNGGFSLRSKKLLEETSKINYKELHLPEDAYVCIKNRKHLNEKGIKFAPLMIAKRFSLECPIDMNEKNITLDAHFGFHGQHGYKGELLELLNDIDNDVESVNLIKNYYVK